MNPVGRVTNAILFINRAPLSESVRSNEMQQKVVDPRQFRVRESIENCIVELQTIGCSHGTALQLLLVQGFIRMSDKQKHVARAFIEDAMAGDDD